MINLFSHRVLTYSFVALQGGMDQKQITDEIAARAYRLRISMNALSEMIGVSSATFSRWRRTVNPVSAKLATLKLFTDQLDKLEAENATL